MNRRRDRHSTRCGDWGKNIHHLHKDSINMPMDGCVDNIHPTDLDAGLCHAYEIVGNIEHAGGKDHYYSAVSQRKSRYLGGRSAISNPEKLRLGMLR